MDAVFDKLDGAVNQALHTLFPATSAGAATAQQRAQDFAARVGVVHAQLAEVRAAGDGRAGQTRGAVLREIEELRADIRAKDEVLGKHRESLARLGGELRRLAEENDAAVAKNTPK